MTTGERQEVGDNKGQMDGGREQDDTTGYNSIYRIKTIIYSSYCNPNQRAMYVVFIWRITNINDLYDYTAQVITGNLIAHLDIAGIFGIVFIHTS